MQFWARRSCRTFVFGRREIFYLDLFRRRTALIASSTVVILSFTKMGLAPEAIGKSKSRVGPRAPDRCGNGAPVCPPGSSVEPRTDNVEPADVILDSWRRRRKTGAPPSFW